MPNTSFWNGFLVVGFHVHDDVTIGIAIEIFDISAVEIGRLNVVGGTDAAYP